uniref:CRAL-TRIO domain-containing protein n=1 Tax=Glossina austeni TaxID=7395 RepID=A0A1A9USN9_GLOAU
MAEKYFDFDGISEFAKEVALKELDETPENVTNGLRELKRLLELETNINVPIDNELWLMNFLRLCKFKPESAKQKIFRHLNLKKSLNFAESFQYDDTNLPKAKGMFCGLKQRDKLGRRVIIIRIEQWDPKILDRQVLLNVTYPILNLLRLEPDTQINGWIFILDLKGLNYTHVLAMTPRLIKTLIDFVLHFLPMRARGYHIVNNPFFFQPIFKLVKQFLPEEFRSLVMMHGKNMSELHRYIAPECLPECYGGTAEDVELPLEESYSVVKKYENTLKHFLECEIKDT